MKSPDCPVCQAPNPWVPRKSNETYYYKTQSFALCDILCSVCCECGFDVVLPQQKHGNEARVFDEHRRIDGVLAGREPIRKPLLLTQA